MLNARTIETTLARIPGLRVLMTLLPPSVAVANDSQENCMHSIRRSNHPKDELGISGPRRSFTKPAKLREHHPILVRHVDR